MKTYKIPALFWFDHEDRNPCDKPEDMAQLIRQCGKNQVYVLANEVQLETLRSDAAFYAEGNVDDCTGLVRSAKSTLKAITKGAVNIDN